MTSPASKWQLLLMAEDGRIIPFRRIRGLVFAFLVLLVVFGLGCAGLGWWLASEMVRHDRTKSRLAEVQLQAAHCLEELESKATAPALAGSQGIDADPAEAQPPGSGLAPKAETLTGTVVKPVKAAVDKEDNERETFVQETATPEGPRPGKADRLKKDQPKTEGTATVGPQPSGVSASPVVAIGDTLAVSYSAEQRVLKAKFRIKTTTSRSSPVEGRCVVVLQGDDPGKEHWLVMPRVPLVDGEPTGTQGRRFKIRRYIDLTVTAADAVPPNTFARATVYVFDRSGRIITQRSYPVDWQAKGDKG